MRAAAKRIGIVFGFGLAMALPGFGHAAAQEAFSVEQCERKSANYLDCQCIADREDELREKESDRLYEVNLGRVDFTERRLATALERLETETNPSRIRGLQNNVEKHEKRLAELKTRPDPASHDPSTLYGIVGSEGSCRSYDKAYAYLEEGCLTTSSTSKGDDAPAYCACVAEQAATEWIETDQPRKRLSNMSVSARIACQG